MTSPPAPTPRTSSTERRSSFEHALRQAADVAALSPSSHNCQPWGVAWPTSPGARQEAALLVGEAPDGSSTDEPETDEYVILALDRQRRLTSLPAHAVEMLISCGAYLQILLHSLALEGWSTDLIRFVDPLSDERTSGTPSAGRPLGDTWPPLWSPLCAVRLRRTDESSGRLAELRETALARRTNRGPYRPEALDPTVLAGLCAPWAGAAEGADVTVRHLVTDGERSTFAHFVARHGGRDFSHRQAWRETHSFLRRNEAEAVARGDGFTLGQLFGPMSGPRRHILRAALAPTTMRVLRHAGYPRLLARQLALVVRPTPAIVTMSFAETAPGLEDAVRGGAHLAEYWMRATDAGLALHPVSVVLQHDDVRTELQDRLGLPGRTFFVSRLGRPLTQFPRSPRRTGARAVRMI
ncbi:nitroreductase family protein [Streptomyces liliifuscus]|uniref:RedV protein n=1 Tax=Streptomyces liliifuscus TaxID=2797636 RepID=UPI001F2BDF72|nr:RedV protein [Streptomyces liliifuscus]